jgi:hypothetical protein
MILQGKTYTSCYPESSRLCSNVSKAFNKMSLPRQLAATVCFLLAAKTSSFSLSSSTRTVHRESGLKPLHMAVIPDPSSSSQGLYSTSLRATALASTETETTASNKEKETKKPSWNDDGFVFGLEGSGLERPKGRNAQIVVEGDSLETQPFQVAAVSVTFAAHAGFLVNSFSGMVEASSGNIALTSIHAIVLTLVSWVIADFGSGVLHWATDNYGNGKTPVMGGIIAAFQGHHSAPWTIAQRGFCNNVYKLCIPFGIVPMLAINAIAPPDVVFFMATFCVFEIMSQEFHKWSHQLKSETPGWVNWLQDSGLTIARKPHALHHLAPFEGNYCIISGICNPVLDQSGFFRRLERVVYSLNGIESNAWKLDPALRERTLSGDYKFPKARSSSSKP